MSEAGRAAGAGGWGLRGREPAGPAAARRTPAGGRVGRAGHGSGGGRGGERRAGGSRARRSGGGRRSSCFVSRHICGPSIFAVGREVTVGKGWR